MRVVLALFLAARLLLAFPEISAIHRDLLKLRLSCPVEIFLNSTTNGHLLFKNSIEYTSAQSEKSDMKRQTECLNSFIPEYERFDNVLDSLTIVMPTTTDERETSMETREYLASLSRLFKVKQAFSEIRIETPESDGNCLAEMTELNLFSMLAPLNIHTIDFRFQICNEDDFKLFATASGVKEIGLLAFNFEIERSGIELFQELTSLIVQPYDGSYIGMLSEYVEHYKHKNMTSATILDDLVAVEFTGPGNAPHTGFASPETISFIASVQPDWLLSSLIDYKSTISSLSITVDLHFYKMILLMSNFLRNNTLLTSLEIITDASPITHLTLDFLDNAVALEDFTITDPLTNTAHVRQLLFFVSSHFTLESLSISTPWVQPIADYRFFAFYRKLIRAIIFNLKLNSLYLNIEVGLTNTTPDKFAAKFARLSVPLLGREFMINDVPVANVVNDLVGRRLNAALKFVESEVIIIGNFE